MIPNFNYNHIILLYDTSRLSRIMAAPENPKELIENNEYDYIYMYSTLMNNEIGCYYCNKELHNKCYTFIQWKCHYDRNTYIMVCNDNCPEAMQLCSVSTCQLCDRDYIHNRYDKDICVSCWIASKKEEQADN